MSDSQPAPLVPTIPGLSGLSVWARGAYATIYRAIQDSIGREVAVKVESRILGSERDKRRFLQEARAAGQMSAHPYVVDLHDVGVTEDQHPYMTMEICDGSYAERLRAAPLGAAETRDVGVKIADALATAHANGALHRNVKPANILISRFGEPLLADFALAVLAETREASITLEVLTPAYAPPETLRHGPPTTAVDVYALSASLYAMLSGRPPRVHHHPNPSRAALLELFDEPIPDLPGVPPAMVDLLRRGMANDALARPTASRLRDLLVELPLERAPNPRAMRAAPARAPALRLATGWAGDTDGMAMASNDAAGSHIAAGSGRTPATGSTASPSPGPGATTVASIEDAGGLRGKVAWAWQEFTRTLAEVLSTLPADANLELVLEPAVSGERDLRYKVAVTIDDDGRLVARAVGNAALPEGYRMNRAAVADMVALGWSPPGVEPESGDSFGLTTRPEYAAQLATLLTRTLRDIYGAPHPAFLEYLASDSAGDPLPVAPLGTARPAMPAGASPTPLEQASVDDAAALREQVRTVVAALQQTTPDKLIADADGDIGLRAGSAMVFVRVRDSPLLVDIFSPILTEVRSSERLYGTLSELTNRMPVGRLYYANDTVWASVPVFGRNFQPSHLVLAVQVMVGLADELDDRLQGEFGGRRFFAEDDLPPRRPGPSATGMYLAEADEVTSAATDLVAVDAYLDTDDSAAAQRVLDALDELALVLGYEGPVDEQWLNGSIWRRARAIRKGGTTSEELWSRLVKVERALELAYVEKQQAEVDAKMAEAVTKLIGSLAEVPQACLRVGSILIVKDHHDGAPIMFTRNLSQTEIRALERYPEIQTKPQSVLDALATAIAGLPSADPDDDSSTW